MPFSNPPSFGFPTRPITYTPYGVYSPYSFDPLRASLSQNYSREYSREIMLSPLCIAASRGHTESVRLLLRFDYVDKQNDIDLALFLANRSEHRHIAALLLDKKANPGRKAAVNGLHGAAWRGLDKMICDYIKYYEAGADVLDGSGATPVIYAILGTQGEHAAWETIKILFAAGASPDTRFGHQNFSYAEIAGREGKRFLKRKLEEWEITPSSSALNSSRESSCMPGEDNDVQSDSEQQRQVPEATGGADSSRDSSCRGRGGDDGQINNKRPRE